MLINAHSGQHWRALSVQYMMEIDHENDEDDGNA